MKMDIWKGHWRYFFENWL